MKTILLLLFISCACFSQPQIKSIEDLPFGGSEIGVKIGKQLLNRLLLQPDTISNEWEKYTVRSINIEENGFYADDIWVKFENDPWYSDTVIYRQSNNSLLNELFKAALNNDTLITCLSYDLSHKLTSEEIKSVCRRENKPSPLVFIIQTPTRVKEYKPPTQIPDFNELEMNRFIVVEKTVRTKGHKIIHQLLAIAPIYSVLDKDTGDFRGAKLLCWFVLK